MVIVLHCTRKNKLSSKNKVLCLVCKFSYKSFLSFVLPLQQNNPTIFNPCFCPFKRPSKKGLDKNSDFFSDAGRISISKLSSLSQSFLLFSTFTIRCHTRFKSAFAACWCVFQEITLACSNQQNYFENETAWSKRTFKTRVATRLYTRQMISFSFFVLSHDHDTLLATW